jgi:uncharacterized protein YceH (UPF0502 family)
MGCNSCDALAVVVQRELAAMNNVKLDLQNEISSLKSRVAYLEQFAPVSR